MYLMYVDESGDPGLNCNVTSTFILTGLVVHELRWRNTLDQLIDFRKRMKAITGIGMREELHASELISRPKQLRAYSTPVRYRIYRDYINELARIPDISLINVVVDKRTKTAGYDVFESAWRALIQRFEDTISHHNFPGPANADERGIIFPDNTDGKKLTMLLRKMRRYNPIAHRPAYGTGYRNRPLSTLIEDPNYRNSRDSYFIQSVDIAAYALRQLSNPSKTIRKRGGKNLFDNLGPILCTVASAADPQGIVRL